MYLNVLAAAAVKLEEANNFGAFKVVVTMPNAGVEEVRRALQNIALLPNRDTAWMFEQALRGSPGHAGTPHGRIC